MTSQLRHATEQWQYTNTRIGFITDYTVPDPYELAAALDARAGWWLELGRLRDDEDTTDLTDVYAVACHYAAILDQEHAARIRFVNRIPTLHPRSVASHLNLGDARCEHCLRPWQLDNDMACPKCPALLFGISPASATQAATYPPGQLWRPSDTSGEDQD